MTLDDARRLLDRIDVLRHPCDLDLLIFFARHPRSLLASQQLAVMLGYEFTRIAASLDVLLRAGLVTLSETPPYAGQMFVFNPSDAHAGWLPELLQRRLHTGRAMAWGALEQRSGS